MTKADSPEVAKSRVDKLDAVGCVLYLVFSYVVGPVACVWLLLKYTTWSSWVSVIVGLMAGGLAGYVLMLVVMLPFAAWADWKKRKAR